MGRHKTYPYNHLARFHEVKINIDDTCFFDELLALERESECLLNEVLGL